MYTRLLVITFVELVKKYFYMPKAVKIEFHRQSSVAIQIGQLSSEF